MNSDELRGKLVLLERRQRWHKRTIAGLMVAFLFTASPTLTKGLTWFDTSFLTRKRESNLSYVDLGKALSKRNRLAAASLILLGCSTTLSSN